MLDTEEQLMYVFKQVKLRLTKTSRVKKGLVLNWFDIGFEISFGTGFKTCFQLIFKLGLKIFWTGFEIGFEIVFETVFFLNCFWIGFEIGFEKVQKSSKKLKSSKNFIKV